MSARRPGRAGPALALGALGLLAAGALSCGGDADPQWARAGFLARAITAACPMSAADDQAARERCAQALAGLAILGNAMAEPFPWGQQPAPGRYNLPALRTTRFNPLVWRRMYLSLFMFSGDYSLEHVGDQLVIHLPCRFRNGLDAGLYPYPFWHSDNKWRDYQQATEVVLVMRGAVVQGALRSATRDADRVVAPRTWDGQWHWDHDTEPRNSLYASLFSARNPYVAGLETAYRALEGEMREHNCTQCHSPDNSADMQSLELLTYPNQALTGRHTIRVQIENNLMPPATATTPQGIPDEAARARMLDLARAFERAADVALEFEGELRAQVWR